MSPPDPGREPATRTTTLAAGSTRLLGGDSRPSQYKPPTFRPRDDRDNESLTRDAAEESTRRLLALDPRPSRIATYRVHAVVTMLLVTYRRGWDCIARRQIAEVAGFSERTVSTEVAFLDAAHVLTYTPSTGRGNVGRFELPHPERLNPLAFQPFDPERWKRRGTKVEAEGPIEAENEKPLLHAPPLSPRPSPGVRVAELIAEAVLIFATSTVATDPTVRSAKAVAAKRIAQGDFDHERTRLLRFVETMSPTGETVTVATLLAELGQRPASKALGCDQCAHGWIYEGRDDKGYESSRACPGCNESAA